MSVPPSLADVIHRIQLTPDLGKRAKQDRVWALRRLAKAFGLPPHDVTANPAALSNRLRPLNAAAAGMTPAAWSNLQSLVRKALQETGCYVHPGRHRTPLTAAWAALRDTLADDLLRFELSRFLHFASARGWPPEAIGDEHFDAFHEELAAHSICRAPERQHRRARLAWNRAVRGIPGWPQRPVAVPKAAPGYCYPWSAFPARLEADVDSYLAARSQPAPFSESALKPLSESSRTSQKFCLRQLASALVERGTDPESLDALADLVQPDRVKTGLKFFLARNGEQTSAQISNIANAALGAARALGETGGLDAAAVETVHGHYKKIEHRPSGMTAKNKDRLRPFAERRTIAKLLHLPGRLLGQCRADPPSVGDALKVRSALAIELLLVFPIRRSNLARIDIEQHLRRTGPTQAPRVFLVIPAVEVKNAQDLEVELTGQAKDLLDRYLNRYRPLLVDQPNAWLFPAHKGAGHLHIRGFGESLTRVIKRETGLDINPHLFRHIAAKLYLDAHPGQFELVRRLLGHRKIETTVSFYAEMDSLMATRLYDDHILKLRAETAAEAPNAQTKTKAA